MTAKETLDAANDVRPGAGETWSVDPTVRIDQLHVIESLTGGWADIHPVT